MHVERWRRIEILFLEALAMSPETRSEFLDRVSAGDQTLRREVESLLEHEHLARTFLESEPSTPAPANGASEPIPTGKTIGPYTILEPLGAGGMGEVYKAHDHRLDRHVAIKFLSRRMVGDPVSLTRFKREAQSASALNHPNICIVHDVGDLEGRPYLVMELLEGQSLRERLANGPLPVKEFTAVARQVCAALEVAHSKGIVHRDIKPANIFVTPGGQVKVLDFGLAKRGEELPASPGATTVPTGNLSLTVAGTIMGTLAYMSPEQAVGGEVEARSDLFSLGVVLYEMATGTTAFRGKTAAGILGSILAEQPAKPSSLVSQIPSQLDRVCLKALAKNPEERYQSAVELSADLARCEASLEGRSRRWALAVAGAGGAALAGAVYLARRSLFSPPQPSIRVAVLPFKNLSGDPKESSLVNGLHSAMIHTLNRLFPDQLGVIAGGSVNRYKQSNAAREQIASELRVEYVVEGGVRREGSQVQIDARLVRAGGQASLWERSYRREIGQIAAAQLEIAQEIARAIERGLQPNAQVSAVLAKPLDGAAHEAYLRGDYNKAVEIDPSYAAAHAGVADRLYYAGLFEASPPGIAFTKMAEAASKAIELDPTQALAHGSLALSRLHQQWNWSAAEESFRRALQLDPANAEVRHWFAHFLLWADRVEESVRECDRAVTISPFDSGLLACRGWHALYANDYDETIKDTRLALTYKPDDAWAAMVMGWAYEQKGMFQEALSSLRRAFESGLKKSSMAHVFARSGNRPAAETILGEMMKDSKTKYISPYGIAVIHAGLEHKEQTFEWLNKAFDEHSSFMVYLSSDPRLQHLRREAAFGSLLRRMGLRDRSG